MIRLDLGDLINRHKPLEELNNNTDNNTNNNNNDNNDNITDHGEWKIQLLVVFLLKVLMKNAQCTRKVKQ